MKVLVSTKETQGQRGNDFCSLPEGELVRFGLECDGEDVDGRCGCRRAMSGMESHRATTTLKVVELPITEDELKKKYAASLVAGGWFKEGDPELKEWADRDVPELARIAATFPTGTVLERRGDDIQVRNKERITRR